MHKDIMIPVFVSTVTVLDLAVRRTEVAEKLGVRPVTVDRWVRAGVVPARYLRQAMKAVADIICADA